MKNKFVLKIHLTCIFAALFVVSSLVNAQTPISIYNSFSGTVNYITIGGSLRDKGNTDDPTSLVSTDTSKMTLPSGATVIGAYLYWAGSGSTTDDDITLDGNSVEASRTFTESYLNGNAWLYFFSGFADVTSYVQSQSSGHTFTFGGLTVDNGGNYVASQAVIAGWSLLIVYNLSTEVKHTISVFDGFEAFRGEQVTFNPNNFYVPYSRVEGKLTHITWEGDKENSTSLNGYNEELKFNGNVLTDAKNPTNEQFNSVSNTLYSSSSDSTFGVDIDTYDITSFLAPADTQATSVYSSGGDLVILSAEIISVADTANSDIQTVKNADSSSYVAGQNVRYTITVYNNGPDTTGTITLYDSLQTGLTFVSSSFSGWTIDSSARPKYKWTHSGVHPPSWNSSITVTAFLTAENYPTQYNTAYASSPQFDRKQWNNSNTDSITIKSPIFLTSVKSYTDLNGGSVRPGDTLLYKISVKNSGNYPAFGIAASDSTPAGMSVVPGSFSPAATYTGTASTGQVITFNSYAGTVNVGDSTAFTFKVVLDSTLLGGSTVTNVAHVKSGVIDQRVTSSFTPVNAPKMIITKSRYASGTAAGDTIYYYMTVKNYSSYATSTNTTISDTIPNPITTNNAAGNAQNPFLLVSSISPSATIASFGGGGANNRDTSLTWNIGTLAPGASATVVFKTVISSTLANGTNIPNRGVVTNTQGSSHSSTYSFIKTATAVTISKFPYPPGSGTGAGDTIQYYIVITNTDTYSTSTNTQVIDTIPNPNRANTNTGNRQNPYLINSSITPSATISSLATPGASNRDTVLTWNLGTLSPGAVDTIIYKMRISSTLANGTYVSNKANVTNDQATKDSSTFVYVKSNTYTGWVNGTRYILPGDTIYYWLYDADLNTSTTTAQTTTLYDTNRVNGERESLVFTETDVNTGIFVAKIPTTYGASAGTNLNGIFNVKPIDSLRITYIDATDSAGGTNGWRNFVTKVLNGHAVALSGTDSVLPTQTIYYTVNDSDLNRSSTTIETYVLRDSNQVTGEIENLTFTETGANTGIFTSSISTVFGTSSNGNNNGSFAVQQGDSVTLKYYDSVIVNGSNGGLKTWKTYIRGGQTATLTSLSATIIPGDSVAITLTDADLNYSSSVAETYTLKDSNTVTGEVESFTVTETGVNTGVFTKKLATTFGLTAGTNNNGIFNVKANDTLKVWYTDTLAANGGPGTLKTASTVVRGGANAVVTATTPIKAGDSILVSITDADLNKNVSVAETYTIKDSSISTGEVETFVVTETGVNTGIFTKKLATTFGLSAGTNNDGTFNVKGNDSLKVTYLDSLISNGGSNTLYAYTRVRTGTDGALTATNPIYPADSILITITDADLNSDTTTIQSYSIKDSSKATGEVETFTITETGVNTGIFTKKLATQFGLTAGTNNDGIFNVKANDTLLVSYRDSLKANGGAVTLTAITKVNGGTTGSITATTPIYPRDSITITVTDADLNKNSSVAETYTIKDSSLATGEVETFTITETGVNTGIFTKKLATQFGTSAGTNNDGIFKVQAGDTLRTWYVDSLQLNGGRTTLTAITAVSGGATATLGSNPIIIAANDSSTFTLTDADLNKSTSVAETYNLVVTSSTTESETMTFTETGVNTGIFTKKVATIFGSTPGPNNNGIFTVHAGDTIHVAYLDSLTSAGDTVSLSTFFTIGTVVFSASSKSLVDNNGGSVKPPDTLAYTVKIKNSGSVTATNVAVKDTVPLHVTILNSTISGSGSASGREISWPAFNLAVGDSMVFTYSLRVDSTITHNVAAVNIYTVNANGVLYRDSASFTPVNRPVMGMLKSVDKASAKPGDTLTYTLTYSNSGTQKATFVTITDNDPNNTTYIANSVKINNATKTDASDADEVTRSGNTLQLNLGEILPGANGTITFKVIIN